MQQHAMNNLLSGFNEQKKERDSEEKNIIINEDLCVFDLT
jgi:hypothetical protein